MTLKNSWNNLLKHYAVSETPTVTEHNVGQSEESVECNIVPLANMLSDYNYSTKEIYNWVQDDGVSPNKLYTDAEIIDMHLHRAANEREIAESDTEDDEIRNVIHEDCTEKISVDAAYKAANIISRWTKQQPEFSFDECVLCDKIKKVTVDKVWEMIM